MNTIGIIGSGNMAEAIIKGLVGSALYKPEDIMASDIRPERLDYIALEYKIKTTTDNEVLLAHAKVIMICVKPQNVKAMLNSIEGKAQNGSLVISIAAGITTEYLARRLSNCQIIRAMPNTPAMVDEGATAIFSANATGEAVQLALRLFSAVEKRWSWNRKVSSTP
jgi:pyrroline-5-carboxylate reductase